MRSAIAALAAALIFLPLAWGQETSSARSITEAEFLAHAEDPSPFLRALAEDVGLARAEVLAARTLSNPRLAASREAPADATEQIDLTVSWQPPRPDRRRLAIDVAEAEVAAAESRLDLRHVGVRLSMREAFAEWAVASERAAALAGFAERLEELARVQRQRAEVGEISGLDARRMELAAAEARAQLATAESASARARGDALVWRPDLGHDLRPVLPDVPLASAPESSSAELAALEHELVAARLERDLTGRVMSLPEIVGGWQRQRSDSGLVAEGPILGLEWPLPLLDHGRAERARAEVRVDALEARLDVAQRSLRARIGGARAAYEGLRQAAIEAAVAGENVEPMVTAATASFRGGEVDLTSLLEILRAGSNARLHAIELRGAALEAQRDLERLAAGSTPEGDR